MEGRPRTNTEQDRVLAQGRSSGECQRLKSDIYLSLSVWHSTSITNFSRENLLSEAFSLMILSLTVLILHELFTLSLSSTLSFGAVATLEFTSLFGSLITGSDAFPTHLSSRALPLPPQGSCSCSSLTPAHEVQFSPLPRTSFASHLGSCIVGIPFPSLTVGTEFSKPFAKYLSVPVTRSCRGTLRLVTSRSRLRFAFGKALATVTLVGRLKCLG